MPRKGKEIRSYRAYWAEHIKASELDRDYTYEYNEINLVQ